jgi:hypothetical protein
LAEICQFATVQPSSVPCLQPCLSLRAEPPRGYAVGARMVPAGTAEAVLIFAKPRAMSSKWPTFDPTSQAPLLRRREVNLRTPEPPDGDLPRSG